MSKFEFSLEAALKLRSREEDAARRRLAEAQHALDSLRRELHHTRESHDRVERMLRENESDEVPLAVFANGRTWLSATRAQMARLRDRIAQAEDTCNQRRDELIAASRAKKTLERLCERRKAEHLQRERRREQRQLDETASLVAGTNITGGPSVLSPLKQARA
ncbi:MAG: flagellar export protein FliJ [Armatimonadetes bacterium]|nr:flagellar export protein FliJ [Armatimonadota bacterium]